MKFYNIDQLNDMEVIYLETSKHEHFELKKLDQGYLLTDITPPEFEMKIAGFRTFNIPRQTIKEMLEVFHWEQPASEVGHFYGVVKGGRFGFHYDNPEETLLTKGTIEKVYKKVQFGDLQMNLHLFDWAGKKVNIKDLGSSFIIHTNASSHHVTILNGRVYFEGKEVFGIHSVMKQMNSEQMIFNKEFDVSIGSIYLNRPFIIITRNGDKGIYSIINEIVRRVERVGS